MPRSGLTGGHRSGSGGAAVMLSAGTAMAGGGLSTIVTEPTYQDAVQSTGNRSTPDVAFDADPDTGVSIYVIPPENTGLGGLRAVVQHSVRTYVAAVRPGPAVTLDVDAHLIEASKRSALPTYEGYRGYQPLLVQDPLEQPSLQAPL